MSSAFRPAALAVGAVGLLAGLAFNADASAATFPFVSHIADHPDAAAIGEQQFGLEVLAGPPGEAHLLVFNDGPEFSSIAGIYIDDSTVNLFNSADVSNGPGVSMFVGDGPPGPSHLPGGGDIGFTTTWLFKAEAPPAHYGVNPDQWTMLIMGLSPGWSVADVVQAMEVGHVRVGLHATSFQIQGDPSASFIMMPEPSLAAAGLAAIGLLLARRRRR